MTKKKINCDVMVLGAGPGGYTAAFRAADLGKNVVIIEKEPTLGGVCLNVGCIPSKALLHAAKVIDETKHMSQCGISFSDLKVDNKKLRAWKSQVISKLTGGLSALSKQRKVKVIQGEGRFTSANSIEVNGKENITVNFEHAIIAAGSRPIMPGFVPSKKDPRIMDSTGALEIEDINCNMLVIGGGIIGLEMATVYHALGAKIHIVELAKQLIPGADADLVGPLTKRFENQIGKKNIMLETKVAKMDIEKDGINVTFEGKQISQSVQKFSRVLVAVGRQPNGDLIDANKAGIDVSERGFISVDNQLRTNVPNIFAIGDIIGQPMLAHKAHAEASIAAEVIAGLKHYFDPRCIPSVAYTDPEIAWTGMTEVQAKNEGINYGVGKFPWAANGRSLACGRDEGMTKILFKKEDNDKNRIIGAGIVGPNAGELIAELSLAIELGCDAEDIGLTIHPHPSLSETVGLAAEAFEGTITDLYMPKK